MSYVGQTSQEMVPLLKHIYRESNGDEYDFVRSCAQSTDTRLNTISHFELEVYFHLITEIETK